MKIGIMCAMQEEIDLLHQDIVSETVTEIAGRTFYAGQLYGVDTVLVMARIGKVAASMTATLLLDHFGVDALLFAGTAGGVDPALHVGDVAIGKHCVQHDFDVPGGDDFRIPLLNISYLESDEKLTNLAFQAVSAYAAEEMTKEIPAEYLEKFGIGQPQVKLGTIASGDQFICDKEKNRWLYEKVKDITCVEMEGAAVAQVCYEWGVPFTVIRVISDGANDDSSVDFDLFIEKAAKYFTRGIVKACLKQL